MGTDADSVKPSTDSVGDCFDNARAESFFATLGCECLRLQRLKAQTDARVAVFDLVEGFYGPHRKLSRLGNLSPINYEMSHNREAA